MKNEFIEQKNGFMRRENWSTTGNTIGDTIGYTIWTLWPRALQAEVPRIAISRL